VRLKHSNLRAPNKIIICELLPKIIYKSSEPDKTKFISFNRFQELYSFVLQIKELLISKFLYGSTVL
jgi:hypothetical protein